MEIPEGYKIESVPESVKIKMPEDIGDFTFIIKKSSENTVQLLCTTKMNNSMIYPSNYQFLKNFYNQIIKKEAEKVVLSKI